MKAIVIEKFGGIEELKLAQIPAPRPGRGEVLIRVSHAGVNPVDWKIREGHLKDLLPHRFPIVLGWDAAGTVEAAGDGVTAFRPGERVYAYTRKPEVSGGAYAEYIVVPASAVARVPQQLGDAEAAALPLAALTAYQALHDFGGIRRGQSVLVHAGAGGVGGYAIQIAKAAGATVVTTASAGKHAYVKALGADHAIDYTKQDVEQELKKLFPNGVDIVLDAVGGETLEKSYSLPKEGGVLVSIVDTPDATRAAKRGLKAGFHFVAPSGEQLEALSRLVETAQLRVPQVEVLPLEQAAAAHLKSAGHRTQGKIVLAV